MVIVGGGESAGSTTSISIAPAYAGYRGPSTNTVEDLSIDELIELARQSAPPKSKFGQRSVDQEAYDKYLQNLYYIQQSKPKMGAEAKKDDSIGMDDILDAIFYASAIATVIPWAPFQIGGRIGMSASMAGRAFSTGNYYQGARYLSNLSREATRDYRRYRSGYQRIGKTKYARKR